MCSGASANQDKATLVTLGQGICVQKVLSAHPLIIDGRVTELMITDIWPVRTMPFQVLFKLAARFAAQRLEAIKPRLLLPPSVLSLARSKPVELDDIEFGSPHLGFRFI